MSDGSGVAEQRVWDSSTARVWIPTDHDLTRSAFQIPPEEFWPWPELEGHDTARLKGRCILIVVSRAYDVLAADTALEGGAHVVVWAWRCPEATVRTLEATFPLVFGVPTREQVEKAFSEGPSRDKRNSLFHDLEIEFRFPDNPYSDT